MKTENHTTAEWTLLSAFNSVLIRLSMNLSVKVSLLVALLALLISATAIGQVVVPNAMNYQGFLTDTNGNPSNPTAAANQDIEFRLYNTSSGGTALWGEVQTVTVFKGNFSVVLGSGSQVGAASTGAAALANVFTNATTSDFFLGIKPSGGAEFTPRQKLLTSAFAFRAKTAESVNASAQPNGVQSQFNWFKAANSEFAGHTKINGRNTLEFGVNDPSITKHFDAGKIGYQLYSDGLDIFGAGASEASRKITLWAEGGTTFKGGVTINGSINTTSPILRGDNHGVFIGSYSNVHSFGSQDHTTFIRTNSGGNDDQGSIAFYRGGSYVSNEKSPGTGNGALTLGILNAKSFLLSPSRFSQCISFYDENNGLGVQPDTTYMRSYNDFAWYKRGVHSNTGGDSGGGNLSMHLDRNGYLNTGGSIRSGGSISSVGSISSGSNLSLAGNTLTFQTAQPTNLWQIVTGGRMDVINKGNTVALLFNNGWYAPSDRRLKQEFSPVTGGLSDVMKLKPTSYHYKSDEEGAPRSFGFVAQEVQEVLPDLVSIGDDEKKTLSLNYNGFIPVTVAAVQEQQKQIETLSTENDTLKKRLADLETRMQKLAERMPETGATSAK